MEAETKNNDPFVLHQAFSAMGLTRPIFQAPCSVAGPELAAAVARGGGVGAMSHYRTAPEAAAQQVRRVQELADGPFQIKTGDFRNVDY